MNELLKKPRSVRIKQAKTPSILSSAGEGGEEHLWAISYADLLMVLLCFFVLFFSRNGDKTKSVIQHILSDQIGHSVNDDGQAVSKSPTTGGQNAIHALLPVLEDLKFTTIKEGEALILLLPDDIYDKGKSELPKSQLVKLKSAFSKLLPYKDQIQITFSGHTDPTPISKSRGKRIEDNFDLSSARAKNALVIAQSMGFSLSQLRMIADASFKRSSRTLSIIIGTRGSP